MRADAIIGKKVLMDYEGLVAAGSMGQFPGRFHLLMDDTVDIFRDNEDL